MGKTVDLVALPARVAEVEESADVVILIKGAEEPLGLLASQAKAAEGHGFPVGARPRGRSGGRARASRPPHPWGRNPAASKSGPATKKYCEKESRSGSNATTRPAYAASSASSTPTKHARHSETSGRWVRLRRAALPRR